MSNVLSLSKVSEALNHKIIKSQNRKIMTFYRFSCSIIAISLLGFTLSMAQLPQWFSTHAHPNYPAEEYIIGVGTGGGATGVESAKKAALADIVAQLRVQVQSEMRTVTESFSINDDEQLSSDFRRQSRTVVSDELIGADVAETVTDTSTQTSYALVVLNRRLYSAAVGSELESGWKQASDLRASAMDFFSKGKMNEAVQSVDQIKQVLAPLYAKQVLYAAAARKPFASASLFNPAALQTDLRTMLSQVQLSKVSGDKQKGKIGASFAQPFVVSVKANGVPCAGVSVIFQLNDRTVLGSANTDEKGNAAFSTAIRSFSGDGIRAKISLSGLGREFEQNVASSSVVFTWTAESSDKAFSITVNAKNQKVRDAVSGKISAAVTSIGYKVVTMSGSALMVDVTSGVPSKIEGMAGTLYNLTLEAAVSLKDSKTGTILGSVKFTAKGVGKSEDEAMQKAASGLKIDENKLGKLLQK